MINQARGEVPLCIEGCDYTLCLTLGALAEIESGLGPERFRQIDTRLIHPKIADIAVILCALLRGGGHDLSLGELQNKQVDLKVAVKAIERAFAVAGLGGGDQDVAIADKS